MARVRDTAAMIAGMDPVLSGPPCVFATLGDATMDLAAGAVATCHEEEGLSVLLPQDVAHQAGFDCALPMMRITLRVHSALDGVGLTAAVATALAGAGIPCNMVAGHHHDHAFVPADQAEAAVTLLREIAGKAAT